MWQPYLDLIRQRCSQALHILDRFHIVAKMNKALDEVRAAESRKLAQDGLRAAVEEIAVVCAEAQSESHRSAAGPSARSAPLQTSKPSDLLKEDFQQFWAYTSPTWAG